MPRGAGSISTPYMAVGFGQGGGDSSFLLAIFAPYWLGLILAGTSWGSKKLAGVVYPLNHLNPFVLNVTPAVQDAHSYRVSVAFGCHTFTREVQGADTPDMFFHNGKETRSFCTTRHAMSLGLPQLIQASASGRAYFSQNTNFLILDNGYGAAGPYVVCFKLEKARKKNIDVAMFVLSAYLKPALPKRLPATTMAALVATVAWGKPITRPKTTTAY